MSELTPNLKLFKYNTETDAKQPFSINDCMNANWDKIDAKCGSSNNILDFKWSDHLLNDQSWLRADTFSWQNGNTYSLVYNELLSEYNNSASTAKTEGSITYKRTPKGYKIALANQETAILNKYNSDGIAWYYILDSANQRFKLPRMKHKYWKDQTTIPVMGNGNVMQFTNGTTDNAVLIKAQTASGEALFRLASNDFSVPNFTNVFPTNGGYGLSADGSKSGVVADVSDVNIETGFYLYFYVGEYTESAEAQTAGLNSELFNGKADVDTPSIQAPYLKTTYINGTSGYNIWSNGYCEQWGYYATQGGNANNLLISFIKTFKNSDYYVDFGVVGSTQHNSGDALATVMTQTKDTNQMTISAGGYDYRAYINGVHWNVKGYLASGQY